MMIHLSISDYIWALTRLNGFGIQVPFAFHNHISVIMMSDYDDYDGFKLLQD